MIKNKMIQDILKINKIQMLFLLINNGRDPQCISKIELFHI